MQALTISNVRVRHFYIGPRNLLSKWKIIHKNRFFLNPIYQLLKRNDAIVQVLTTDLHTLGRLNQSPPKTVARTFVVHYWRLKDTDCSLNVCKNNATSQQGRKIARHWRMFLFNRSGRIKVIEFYFFSSLVPLPSWSHILILDDPFELCKKTSAECVKSMVGIKVWPPG